MKADTMSEQALAHELDQVVRRYNALVDRLSARGLEVHASLKMMPMLTGVAERPFLEARVLKRLA